MKDIYTTITDRIIEQLENGIIPWRKPWTGAMDGAISHVTGKPYSLLNQLILEKSGEYLTFNCCRKEGGRVKKGATHKDIYFWTVKVYTTKDANGNDVLDDNGNPVTGIIPFLKPIQVFHIDDCEGISARFASNDDLPVNHAEPSEEAESIFHDYIAREKISFESELSNKAYYSPIMDTIHLPLISQFENTAEYYSTAFHEATHSTGHKSRLDRFSGKEALASFGSESYSKEELCAEIGAATILNHIGMETPSSFKNSAAYIQSWLRALKNDKRLIVGAASRAEKAVKLILNLKDDSNALEE